LVVTDGLCGSACCQFISQLRYLGKVGVVAIGGLPGSNYDICSFPGGNVLEWDDIVNCTLGKSFVNFLPTTARTRFNHMEMYMGQQSVPREFIIIPPDFVLNQSQNILDLHSATYDEYLYSNVSTLFGSISYAPLGSPFQSMFPDYIVNTGTTYSHAYFLILVVLFLQLALCFYVL